MLKYNQKFIYPHRFLEDGQGNNMDYVAHRPILLLLLVLVDLIVLFGTGNSTCDIW